MPLLFWILTLIVVVWVPVEEILFRTQHETLQKIYNLPQFGTTLEFLTMLALSSGKLHKVRLSPPLPFPTIFLLTISKLVKGGTPDILAAARQVLMDWNHQKILYFSVPPSIHPSSIPSVVPNTNTTGVVIAPGAENVGRAQILGELGKPFELEGLFGRADAGAFGCGAGEDEEMMDEEKDGGEAELMDEDG